MWTSAAFAALARTSKSRSFVARGWPWYARMPAQHHELRARVVKLNEQIAEVVGQVDHTERPGTNRQGMWSQV
jgi:hypothetical protein